MAQRLHAAISTAVLAAAAHGVAHASAEEAVGVTYLSSGRAWAALGMLVGLAGVFLARRALSQAAAGARATHLRSGGGALIAGVLAVALGAVVTSSAGPIGSGGGRGGAFLAIAMGVVSASLSGLSFLRRKRNANS